MSGPRQPSISDCTTTTTTTTSSTARLPVAIAGYTENHAMKLITEGGYCHDNTINSQPVSSWEGPLSISWVDASIVGCSWICSGCRPGECYSFNIQDGWIAIRSPIEITSENLNETFTYSLSGSLLNVDNDLYYISWTSDTPLQVYSTAEDNWSFIESDRPNYLLNDRCVIDLGGREIFAQFSIGGGHGGTIDQKVETFNYKFNLDTSEWLKLPENSITGITGSYCLKIDLPGGGAGVMKIGGYYLEEGNWMEPWITKEVRTVEILDLQTQKWTVVEPFDSRWILENIHSSSQSTFSNYGFFHLGEKPTLIGQFNDTNINVMEQYDVKENLWTLEDFDASDAPCGNSYPYPCIHNVANIPTSIFPPCTL